MNLIMSTPLPPTPPHNISFSLYAFVYELCLSWESFYRRHVSGELFSLCSPSCSAQFGDWSPDPSSCERSLSQAAIWQLIMEAFEVFISNFLPHLRFFFLCIVLSVSLCSLAQYKVSGHQSPECVSAGLPTGRSIMLKCRLSNRLQHGRSERQSGIGARLCFTPCLDMFTPCLEVMSSHRLSGLHHIFIHCMLSVNKHVDSGFRSLIQ